MIIGRSDQRGFLRMGIESTITFKICGSENVYEGLAKDLSATGIRFTTRQKINVGDLLEISMKPGLDITPPLITTLAVVRVKKPDDDTYDVAGIMQKIESS